jgi:hypothetical protein
LVSYAFFVPFNMSLIISSITVFMLLLHMMWNEIGVLIFGYGGYVLYTLLE